MQQKDRPPGLSLNSIVLKARRCARGNRDTPTKVKEFYLRNQAIDRLVSHRFHDLAAQIIKIINILTILYGIDILNNNQVKVSDIKNLDIIYQNNELVSQTTKRIVSIVLKVIKSIKNI